MKFNDGFWLLKHGVQAFYGQQITKTSRTDAGELILQVATRPIRHRGDTLGGPIITVKLHSPAPGIIGVKIEHFRDPNPHPAIPLFPFEESSSPKLSLSEDGSELSSGPLTAVVKNKPYTIEFFTNQRLLTSAGAKHQALFDVPYKWTTNSAPNSSCLAQDFSSNPVGNRHPAYVRYINSELTISPGELFYGLGEQFGPYVKNGQCVSIWNRDGGTSSEQAYKCVPFYMSNRGYGVFINNFGDVEVEVGSEKVSRVGFSVPGESLEFFVIYGDTPLDVLAKYTSMTGKPALPPSWTFGLWLSTSFLTDYSAGTVSEFLSGMQERNCPVRVFHLDCFWMAQYEWCSFTFDPTFFPDPKAYLTDIKSKFNVKICVWINPYFSQHSPIFDEGIKGGYFLKRENGTVWQWDLWQPGLAILDVTNPKAREWYISKLAALLDIGVDAFKTDFAERIPHEGIVYHDGADVFKMHNAYSVMYNQMVFELLVKRFGVNEAVVFARSSSAGGQRFPVHWGGDCESTFEAMAETLRGCLSLTTSGFAYTSHDIGGFEGTPPAEIYLRWLAFGLFSSHSRLHGSSSYRVPWQYGEDAPKVLSKFLNMKHALMPHIYKLAIEANARGYPVQRAMWLEFCEDRTTHHLEQQYMLGPSLLVAPSFVYKVEATEYYIPKGRWTSLWDMGKSVTGPRWVKEVVPIDHIPIWVRPGSVLPFGPRGVGRPDYAYGESIELIVFELSPGEKQRVEIPSGVGNDIKGAVTISRADKRIIIDLRSLGGVAIGTVVLVQHGLHILEATGGDKVEGAQQKVIPKRGAKEITIQMG